MRLLARSPTCCTSRARPTASTTSAPARWSWRARIGDVAALLRRSRAATPRCCIAPPRRAAAAQRGAARRSRERIGEPRAGVRARCTGAPTTCSRPATRTAARARHGPDRAAGRRAAASRRTATCRALGADLGADRRPPRTRSSALIDAHARARRRARRCPRSTCEAMGQRLALAYRTACSAPSRRCCRPRSSRTRSCASTCPALALAHLQAGDREAAAAEFEQLARRLRRVPARHAVVQQRSRARRGLRAARRHASGRPTLYDAPAPLPRPHRDGRDGLVLGLRERFLGLLARTRSDWAAAVAHFEAALAANAAAGIVSMAADGPRRLHRRCSRPAARPSAPRRSARRHSGRLRAVARPSRPEGRPVRVIPNGARRAARHPERHDQATHPLLHRPQVGGVAGGLAHYFNLDPILSRVGFVAATLLTGGAGGSPTSADARASCLVRPEATSRMPSVRSPYSVSSWASTISSSSPPR